MFGFKEWTLICEALGSGAQSIILRKGGIAEGRAGFHFEHPRFLLFPTLFHEQAAKLRVPPATPLPAPREDGQIEIRYHAEVEWTHEITDPALIRPLAEFHLWRDEVIEERFRYDEKQGVSLAFVRTFRFATPFLFPNLPKYGGCRSWVNLPDPPATLASEPVLEEGEHRSREDRLRLLLQ